MADEDDSNTRNIVEPASVGTVVDTVEEEDGARDSVDAMGLPNGEGSLCEIVREVS